MSESYKPATADEARLLSHLDAWDKTAKKGKYDSRKQPSEEGKSETSEDTSQNAPDDAKASTKDTQAEKPNDTSKDTSSSSADNSGHNWEKRYGDSQRYISQLKDKQKELSDTNSDLITKLSKVDLESLPKTKEELEAYRKKQPELYDILVTMVGENVAKRDEALSNELDKLKSKQTEIQKTQRLTSLLESHPDIMEIQNDPNFQVWYDVQPNSIQGLVDSDNVESVKLGVDKYKRDTGITVDEKAQAKKQKQVQGGLDTGTTSKAAPDVNSDGKKQWSESEILRKSNADKTWFEKHMAEIDVANAEGRVTYDISAGM